MEGLGCGIVSFFFLSLSLSRLVDFHERSWRRDLTRLVSFSLLCLSLLSTIAVRTGQAHRTLIGHTGPVTTIQFDEMHVISGSLDKTIRVRLSISFSVSLRFGFAGLRTVLIHR